MRDIQPELRPCPFCGGETPYVEDIWLTKGLRWYVFCPTCGATGGQKKAKAEAIVAWNTRATHGTLTAEQVEKAIHDCSTYASYDGRTYYASGIRLQAIADELNAVLGSGTCEWVLEHSGTLYDKWRCSKCGYLYVESRTDGGATDLDPKFCPNCGRKVVSA